MAKLVATNIVKKAGASIDFLKVRFRGSPPVRLRSSSDTLSAHKKTTYGKCRASTANTHIYAYAESFELLRNSCFIVVKTYRFVAKCRLKFSYL